VLQRLSPAAFPFRPTLPSKPQTSTPPCLLCHPQNPTCRPQIYNTPSQGRRRRLLRYQYSPRSPRSHKSCYNTLLSALPP
jgi:hypothetical protein